MDRDGNQELPPSGPEEMSTRSSPADRGSRGPTAGPMFSVGQRLGHYVLNRCLGQGGYGQVWEAEDARTRRRVALKVLTELRAASPDSVERFRREGRLAASLSHPRCVFVFSAEEVEGYPVIVMELMPGGTLQDTIDAGGLLPSAKAVDYILDVLSGLEAAHAAGILHRDLKPSNCFLDADGRAKVGDFGLSRTLEADAGLTATGAFLGTPYYASPEQVRGRDVDFRSDFYSLGATLYTLLTGKPPFPAAQAGEALARILSEPPTPFSEHRVKVPVGLQRLVMRLLAKDKERRFASHAALQAALAAYSSQALSAAGLARRLGASLVDKCLLLPLECVRLLTAFQPGVSKGVFLASVWFFPLLHFLYFLLVEGKWGRSLGKLLFGVRVTDSEGAPPSLARVALRTAIFVAFSQGPVALFGSLAPLYRISAAAYSVATPLAYFGMVVLFGTMRRRNGFAGLHEMASRTRVVEVPGREAIRLPPPSPVRAMPLSEPPGYYGPFRVTGVIWKSGTEALLLGQDEVLGRRIWIHHYRDPARARAPEKLASLRAGRLRWLQGSRDPGSFWDAFEAPTGASLVEWVVQGRSGLSWAQVRRILLDLVEELETGNEAQDLPVRISLAHVWVDAHGQAKLLGFPSTTPTTDSAHTEVPSSDWPAFFERLLPFVLEGEVPQVPKSGRAGIHVHLPEHTRGFLESLHHPSSSLTTLGDVRRALQDLLTKPARITRTRRLGSLAPVFLFALLPSLGGFGMQKVLFSIPLYRDARMAGAYCNRLKQLDRNAGAPEAPGEREGIRILLASTHSQAWNNPAYHPILADMPREVRETMKQAARDHPSPTLEQVAEARNKLPANLQDPLGHVDWREVVGFSAVLVSGFAVPAVILSFVLKGGLLLTLFGMAVQTGDGRRASRFRCLARSLLAWSPALVIPIAGSLGVNILDSPAILSTLAAILALGSIYAILRPERGIPDLIAGTHLVPR